MNRPRFKSNFRKNLVDKNSEDIVFEELINANHSPVHKMDKPYCARSMYKFTILNCIIL